MLSDQPEYYKTSGSEKWNHYFKAVFLIASWRNSVYKENDPNSYFRTVNTFSSSYWVMDSIACFNL